MIKIFNFFLLLFVVFITGCSDDSVKPTETKPFRIIFWTNVVNSSITVKVNGIRYGEITQGYPSGSIDCNATGCVSAYFDKAQMISLEASEPNGKVWQETISVYGSCQKHYLYNVSKKPATYDLMLYTIDEDLIPISGTVNGKSFSITANYVQKKLSFDTPRVNIFAFSTGSQSGVSWNEDITLKVGTNNYCFQKKQNFFNIIQ